MKNTRIRAKRKKEKRTKIYKTKLKIYNADITMFYSQ